MRACRLLVVLVVSCVVAVAPTVASAWRAVPDPSAQPETAALTTLTRSGPVVTAHSWYLAWNGKRRALIVGYPDTGRAVPLVVTAHPAGMSMFCTDINLRRAAAAGFALACIGGQGVATRAFSYGSAGQIFDLSVVPKMITERLPAIRIDTRKVYLAGSSMGGMEALLVALRYPHAYDAVVALDPVTDLSRRFRSLPLNRRDLLQAECGGPPTLRPLCYAVRSPLELAGYPRPADTPLAIWYSHRDPVSGEPFQAPRFVDALARADEPGTVNVRIGGWPHGALWSRPSGRRAWLADFGLRWPEVSEAPPPQTQRSTVRGRVARHG